MWTQPCQTHYVVDGLGRFEGTGWHESRRSQGGDGGEPRSSHETDLNMVGMDTGLGASYSAGHHEAPGRDTGVEEVLHG